MMANQNNEYKGAGKISSALGGAAVAGTATGLSLSCIGDLVFSEDLCNKTIGYLENVKQHKENFNWNSIPEDSKSVITFSLLASTALITASVIGGIIGYKQADAAEKQHNGLVKENNLLKTAIADAVHQGVIAEPEMKMSLTK